MTSTMVIEQLLNGLQFGLMLFLIASGLTLIFGIMDIMNLAHGTLYMSGAYIASMVMAYSGSFVQAVFVSIAVTVVLALLLELFLMRYLVMQSHLSQVLGTYAVILITNDIVKIIWGPAPIMFNLPQYLSGPINLMPGLSYSSYRILIIIVGLLVAIGLYVFVTRTKAGVLVRAGASDRTMASLM